MTYIDPTGHAQCRTEEECEDMGTTPMGTEGGSDGGNGNSDGGIGDPHADDDIDPNPIRDSNYWCNRFAQGLCGDVVPPGMTIDDILRATGYYYDGPFVQICCTPRQLVYDPLNVTPSATQPDSERVDWNEVAEQCQQECWWKIFREIVKPGLPGMHPDSPFGPVFDAYKKESHYGGGKPPKR